MFLEGFGDDVIRKIGDEFVAIVIDDGVRIILSRIHMIVAIRTSGSLKTAGSRVDVPRNFVDDTAS